MKFLVKGFEWVHWTDLEVHPEAKVPIAEEDAAALKTSVEDNGMIQPLVVILREVIPAKTVSKRGGKVMEKVPARKRFWIVDGANRFATCKKKVDDVLPCVVVETDSVRDLALECASVGRSRSAGQRIMVYLERHKEEVLQAAEKGQELAKGGRSPFAVSRDTATDSKGFSSEEIAKALGVSKQDTLLAIDLLNCHERREGVTSVVGGLREEGRKLEEGDPELKAIDEAWAGVLAGRTPIRRWKAAVGGRSTTKDVQRSETNVVKSGVECAKKFKTFGGKAWERIPLEDRILVLDAFRQVAELVPKEVLEVLHGEWERRHG